MTPKMTAARATRHLKTIRAAAFKLAHEYLDVDTYLERRADEIVALVDEIQAEIAEWAKQPEEK